MEIFVKDKTPNYPYLGVSHDGEVVLFSAYGTGTRLRTTNPYNSTPIYYSTSWRMENFKPFEGEIKVSA